MARQGEKIVNARTGQTMVFLKTAAETNGKLLQIECFSPPSARRETEHVHPFQTNSFSMISGSCVFWVEGREMRVSPGESLDIPPNVRHHFWNPGDIAAHYVQEFRPALHIDEFFETFFALSLDDKLNAQGIPNLLHGSLIMLKHRDHIRVSHPPWAVQLPAYLTLAPIGWIMGYRSVYPPKNLRPSLRYGK